MYQATVLLPGRFEEGRFSSPYLPAGLKVRLGGRAYVEPEHLVGEGIYSHWPRTNATGEITSLILAGRVRQVPDSAVRVQGILLQVTDATLTFRIEPRGKTRTPFRIHLRRAPELTEHMELNKPYRVEGRLEGMQLVAERAYPLDWPEIVRKPCSASAKPAKKPAPASRQPALEQPTPAPPAPVVRRRVRNLGTVSKQI
jgi:hypothetical protein